MVLYYSSIMSNNNNAKVLILESTKIITNNGYIFNSILSILKQINKSANCQSVYLNNTEKKTIFFLFTIEKTFKMIPNCGCCSKNYHPHSVLRVINKFKISISL